MTFSKRNKILALVVIVVVLLLVGFVSSKNVNSNSSQNGNAFSSFFSGFFSEEESTKDQCLLDREQCIDGYAGAKISTDAMLDGFKHCYELDRQCYKEYLKNVCIEKCGTDAVKCGCYIE